MLRCLGVALFFVLLCSLDPRSVLSILLRANLLHLVLAALFLLLTVYVRGERWAFLLKKCDVTVSRALVLRANYSSVLFSFITPGRIGELGKAFMLRLGDPTAVVKATATVFYDRLWDVGVIVAFGMISTLGLELDVKVDLPVGAALLLGGGFVLALGIWLLKTDPVRQFLERIAIRNNIDSSQIKSLFSNFGATFWKTTPVALGLTILSLGFQVVMAHFFAAALSLHLSPVELVFFVCSSTLVSLLPISFAGLGTRDGVFVFVFMQKGYSPEAAIGFSFCFFLGNLFLAFVGWLFWVLMEK